MGNPNPKISHLTFIPRQDNTTAKLASGMLSARVAVDIDAAVRSLPNRSGWLRRVITEAVQRELLNENQ